jgi:hypothetical protein
LLGGPSIDEPLEYSGRYWGMPGRLFHKDTLYSPVDHYMYLGQKSYVEDTLTVLKMTMFRDDIVEYTLNNILNKHKDWKLVYTPQGHAHDIDSMHSIIQNVTGFFKNKEYSTENVEKFQHFILEKRRTLVSPSLVREMLKFYRII